MEKFVIAVYVDNQFGVLTRVTSMFTRRGFNIDSLTVGETETPAYSRITITMSGTGAELLADEKVKEAYLGKKRGK